MKFLSLLIAIISASNLSAQTEIREQLYKSSYVYEMDDFFRDDLKLQVHLDTLLSAIFDELDSSRSCHGDLCKPDYYVCVVVGTHAVKDIQFAPNGFINYGKTTMEKYSFSTIYGFNSYLLLKDANHEVKRIYYITRQEEDFEHKYNREFIPAYQSGTTVSKARNSNYSRDNNQAVPVGALTNAKVLNRVTDASPGAIVSDFGPMEFIKSGDKNLNPTALMVKQQVLLRLLELKLVR